MPIIIPPRGTKPPPETPRSKGIPQIGGKPLVAAPQPRSVPKIPPRKTTPILPSSQLGAAAFNKAKLPNRAKLEALTQRGLEAAANMAPGQRLTVLPEAKHTDINIGLQELLDKHPLPPLPTGEYFQLRDWQGADIMTLLAWSRVGVYLPVGAGKTVIASLVALAYSTEFNVVVLPPILIGQWVRWINSIGNSGGAVAYKGSKKRRDEINLLGSRWWIMSYGIFKNDFQKLFKLIMNHSVTLIVDEAQAVKNSGTDLWKKCNTFSLGRNLIMMTGTELNSPEDAYGYIKLKTPTIYSSFGHFERVHAGKVDFFGKVQEWVNLDLLNENLYFQSVQRTKEEVHAHLPRAKYMPFPYELDPAHKRLYDELTEKQILLTEQGGKWDATTSQALYNYSQQLVINLNKFSGNPDSRPAIFDVIDTLVDSLGFGVGHGPRKFIVWTWFQDSTRTIAEYLETLYPGRVRIAYGLSDSAKAADAFENDPDVWWLVAQPLSAGAGWNPQYVCYNSLFVEVPTRTIPFRQAAGRIDREGQKESANIWIAQAQNTIQTFLYNNLLSNDELVQRVQGNPRDLRAIISGT